MSRNLQQMRENNLELSMRTLRDTKSTIPDWVRELARTALDIAGATRNAAVDEQCQHTLTIDHSNPVGVFIRCSKCKEIISDDKQKRSQ